MTPLDTLNLFILIVLGTVWVYRRFGGSLIDRRDDLLTGQGIGDHYHAPFVTGNAAPIVAIAQNIQG